MVPLKLKVIANKQNIFLGSGRLMQSQNVP